jgi:uncharacterized protein (TIGR02246 family)
MTTQTFTADTEIRALYQQLPDAWNRRDRDAYAKLFGEDSSVVGFDGTEMTGSAEIATTLRKIFTDHATGVYRGKVRGVRMLSPDVALLRAITGLVPAKPSSTRSSTRSRVSSPSGTTRVGASSSSRIPPLSCTAGPKW